MPPGRGLVPPFDQTPPEEAANMSPVIMTGVWEDRKADHDLHGRLRSVPSNQFVVSCLLHAANFACARLLALSDQFTGFLNH